jgi:hypothetical protein
MTSRYSDEVKRLVIGVALCCSACSHSPTSPSQSAPVPALPTTAALAQIGGLNTSHCERLAGDTRWLCAFTADAENRGAGCANHIRGVVSTYRQGIPSNVLNTANWNYGAIVRPGERFTYTGDHVVLGDEPDWVYHTEFQWENVSCP